MAVMSISQNILNKREIDNKYRSVGLQKQLILNESGKSATELNKIITGQYLASFSTLTDLVFNRTFLELLNDLCGISDTTAYGISEPHIVINGLPDIQKSPY